MLHFIKILFLAGILFPCNLVGQYGKKLNQKKLKKDFELAIEELEEVHPALYRFITKDSLDSVIERSRAELANISDQFGLYKILCNIYSSIGDGHTKILVDEILYNTVQSKFGIFPYDLWLNETNELFVIERNLEDGLLKLGDEIVKINDWTIDEFIEEVKPYVSFEHTAYRNSLIAHNFNWLLTLISDPLDYVDIQLRGQENSIEIPLVDFNQWKENEEIEYKKKRKHLFDIENNEYKQLTEDIGYLKIYEFGSYKLSQYTSQVRKIFEDIERERISSLIIDLRGNSGGNPDYVEALIHSISDIPFCRTEMIFQVRNGPMNSFYKPEYTSASLGDENSLKNYLYFGEAKAYRQPKWADNEFEGDLYLLIDEDSYSATTSLASVFKCYNLGTVVGNMTGGTRIFQAYSQPKKLPKSKITCYVSSTLLYTSCSGFHDVEGYREGVEPHFVVNKKIEDFISDSDSQLDFVLGLIKNKTNR